MKGFEMEVITIEESPYGDEYWFGGANGGTIEVAERWVYGGEWFKDDAQKLENMRNEAQAIKEALELLQEGKTPRQLAEENAKLRKLCGDFLTVSVCAINAGDWKVDGAADPDSLIREAQRII